MAPFYAVPVPVSILPGASFHLCGLEVVDRHCFDADLDADPDPAFDFDADPDPGRDPSLYVGKI